MTISVSVVDNQAYTAGPGWRYAFSSFLGSGGLVEGATDMPVTALGTPNMTVNVGTGQAWVEGTYLTTSESGVVVQGSYWVQNDTVYNLPIPAANSSLGRIDLVCVVVTDSNEGQAGTTGATIIDVPGTPSASPIAPTPPVSSIVLAQINVGAGATAITSSDITLLYPQATLTQAMQTPVQSIGTAGPPTGQYALGSAVLDSNSNLWVNPGGSFVEVQPPATPTPAPSSPNAGRAYVPALVQFTQPLIVDTWTEDWVSGDVTIGSAGVTIGSDGIYCVVCNVQISNYQSDFSGSVSFTVNGTAMQSYFADLGTGQLTLALSDIINLNASDVISVHCEEALNETCNLLSGKYVSWLSVFQVVGA